jgi:hypothetical protein
MGGTITGEMCERLRQFEIVLRNPNRVVLIDLRIRFQMPEPIIGIIPIDHSPGSQPRFRPEQIRGMAIAKGSGSVSFSGRHSPTRNWQLEVDRLTPNSYFHVQGVTQEAPSEFFPEAFLAHLKPEEELLRYHAHGFFAFEFRSEYVTRELALPIFFDEAERNISCGEVQSGFAPWRALMTRKFG